MGTDAIPATSIDETKPMGEGLKGAIMFLVWRRNEPALSRSLVSFRDCHLRFVSRLDLFLPANWRRMATDVSAAMLMISGRLDMKDLNRARKSSLHSRGRCG